MSTHYLVDLFQPDVSFTSSEINSVKDPPSGQSLLGGNFVVRVPSNVSVQNPTSLSDLLTKKYAGIMAAHAGYARMAYDTMLDDVSIDKTAAGTNGTFGKRGVNSINSGGGKLFSTTATLSGSPAVAAVMTWEVFDYVSADPAAALGTRTFREQPSTGFTCEVSFNGGTTWKTVLDGAPFSLSAIERGTSFITRFTNAGGSRLWLGSWAVLY